MLQGSFTRFHLLGFTIGMLLIILGASELVPAIVDHIDGHPNAHIFLENALMCLFFGGVLVVSHRARELTLNIRQTFMLTTLSWVLLSAFAALPLYMSDLGISYTDAFFESMSGITTTGSTVLSGLDKMSHGVLLWRSIIQWLGGIGIIGFAIVFLPFLRVGGMQLFQTESSDQSEKVMPRSRTIVTSLFIVYCGLTLACAFSYHVLGMSWFDAINHALTTLCTGGYSTHDASFGGFPEPALQWSGTLFMFLGGLPFVLYVKLFFRGRFAFFEDVQFKAIVLLLLFFIAVVVVWLQFTSDYGLFESITLASFNIVSIVTTTGYATTDYTLWGPFAVMLFFLMTYLGACAGSTTGGMKVMRLVIVAKALGRQFKTLLYPHGLFTIRYQGKTLEHNVVVTVLGFLSLYVVSNVFLTLALALSGLDFATAISSAATAIANVGPGIGDVVGPSGNFSSLPDISKWLLCAGMLLGRLEILTVIVLFMPAYWRD